MLSKQILLIHVVVLFNCPDVLHHYNFLCETSLLVFGGLLVRHRPL